MKILRSFLTVALCMTAPVAMAVTGDEQFPTLVSVELCRVDAAVRPRGCLVRKAAIPDPRAQVRQVSKARKIIRLPWMIGAFQ